MTGGGAGGAIGWGAKAGEGVGTRTAGEACWPGVDAPIGGGTATGDGAPPAVGGATPTIVPLSRLGGPPLAPGGAPMGRGAAPGAAPGGAAGAAPAGGAFGIWG